LTYAADARADEAEAAADEADPAAELIAAEAAELAEAAKLEAWLARLAVALFRAPPAEPVMEATADAAEPVTPARAEVKMGRAAGLPEAVAPVMGK
jgi:hypothetical protein